MIYALSAFAFITVVLIVLSVRLGQPCIKSKCTRLAKKGHSYCARCEREAGLL